MFITSYRNSASPQQLDAFDMFYRGMELTQTEQPITTFQRTLTQQVDCIRNPFTFPLEELRRVYDRGMRIPYDELQYHSFRIPKSSGGYRLIQEPNDELKTYQRDLVLLMKHCGVLHHDCAYAYIEKRSVKDAIMQHQANESNWFLKLDLKDFFPSLTWEEWKNEATKIFPICETDFEMYKPCFLNGSLPQGAPSSPFLSNVFMIPYDYAISRALYNHKNRRYIYTRYADDILISCQETFDKQEIIDIVRENLPAYLHINEAKTRYGSRAGQNWNLGLMLNKDNDITIGYREKQRLRAAIFAFAQDYKKGVVWNPEDKAHLHGQLAYLRHIQPEYHDAIIAKYNSSFQLDILQLLRKHLDC